MKVEKIDVILNRFNYCIENDKPFSLIRFGDGGIKFLHSLFFSDLKQMAQIIEREGLPPDKLPYVLKLWGYYSRQADYIDTPEVYFMEEFWPRLRKPTKEMTGKTRRRLKMWKNLYDRAEMDNVSYCNPEANYLIILDDRINLLDIISDRKVCIIAATNDLQFLLRSMEYNVDVFPIVKQYENHYRKSFNNVVNKIENDVKTYDFWLVAAGELGRLYTGLIKERGGRALDIGFVAEFWCGESIHPRLHPFLKRSEKNKFLLSLHEDGLKYSDHI
jgi:hypothetical protein